MGSRVKSARLIGSMVGTSGTHGRTEGEILAVGGNSRKNGLMDAADLRPFPPFAVEFAFVFPGPDGGGGPRAA